MPPKIRRKKKEEEATKVAIVKIHQRFSSNINVRFVTMIPPKRVRQMSYAPTQEAIRQMA